MVRVLVVHNRYRSELPSGENRVVDNEVAALRAAQVDVDTYLRSSDELADLSLRERLQLVASPVRAPVSLRAVDELIQAQRPDVLHLHNPYPLISLGVVGLAKERGVAVVHTVHNHRHTCMSGSFERAGRPCHDCVGTGPLPGVLHGCYRGSRAQSAVMATALMVHRRTYQLMDRVIALTQEGADSVIRAGVSPDRVVVKANTVPDPGSPTGPGSGVLYVGRLSREKGTLLLLEAWRRHGPGALGMLTLVGDGPAAAEAAVLAADRPDISLQGSVSPTGVLELMRAAAVVVLPSTAAEALPLTVLEAMAAGRAIAVSAVGGLPSVVDSSTGWVVPPDVDSWARALPAIAAGDHARLGAAARQTYEQRFAPQAVLEQLLAIYRAASEHHRGLPCSATG